MLLIEALALVVFEELLSAELKAYRVYSTAILSRFKVLLFDVLKGAYLVFIDGALSRGAVLLYIRLLMLDRIVSGRRFNVNRRVNGLRLRLSLKV